MACSSCDTSYSRRVAAADLALLQHNLRTAALPSRRVRRRRLNIFSVTILVLQQRRVRRGTSEVATRFALRGLRDNMAAALLSPPDGLRRIGASRCQRSRLPFPRQWLPTLPAWRFAAAPPRALPAHSICTLFYLLHFILTSIQPAFREWRSLLSNWTARDKRAKNENAITFIARQTVNGGMTCGAYGDSRTLAGSNGMARNEHRCRVLTAQLAPHYAPDTRSWPGRSRATELKQPAYARSTPGEEDTLLELFQTAPS